MAATWTGGELGPASVECPDRWTQSRVVGSGTAKPTGKVETGHCCHMHLNSVGLECLAEIGSEQGHTVFCFDPGKRVSPNAWQKERYL